MLSPPHLNCSASNSVGHHQPPASQGFRSPPRRGPLQTISSLVECSKHPSFDPWAGMFRRRVDSSSSSTKNNTSTGSEQRHFERSGARHLPWRADYLRQCAEYEPVALKRHSGGGFWTNTDQPRNSVQLGTAVFSMEKDHRAGSSEPCTTRCEIPSQQRKRCRSLAYPYTIDSDPFAWATRSATPLSSTCRSCATSSSGGREPPHSLIDVKASGRSSSPAGGIADYPLSRWE